MPLPSLPPPPPFRALKNHIEGKWLRQVYDEEGQVWLPLEDWMERFDPDNNILPGSKKKKKDDDKKKKPKKKDNALQKKVKQKARDAFLSKLETNVTDKMNLLLLEIVAKVLNESEGKLRELQAQEQQKEQTENDTTTPTPSLPKPLETAALEVLPADPTLVLGTTASLLNHVSAVLLAYRFAQHAPQNMPPPKAHFFKTVAVQRLAGGLYPLVQDLRRGVTETTAKAQAKANQLSQQAVSLPALQQALRAQLQQKLGNNNNFVADLVNTQLDTLFATAQATSDQVVDQAHDQIAQRLAQAPDQIYQTTGLQPPQLPKGLQPPSADDIKHKKDEMGQMVEGLIRQTVQSKLTDVQDYILYYLEQLLVAAAVVAQQCHAKAQEKMQTASKLKQKAQDAKAKALPILDETEFATELAAHVEELYQHFTNTLQREVHQAVQALGGLLEEAHTVDSPEEEEDDE